MYDGKNLVSSDLLFSRIKGYFPQATRNEAEMSQALYKVVSSHPSEFSANLRTLRKSKGMAPAFLASQIGVSIASYYAWENATRVPKLDRIRALADLLDADPGELISRNPDAAIASKSVPVLSSDFFVQVDQPNFRNKVERTEQKLIKILDDESTEFAFINPDNTDMIGMRHQIPIGACVLCSTRELSGSLGVEDRLKAAGGCVAVVSKFSGPAMLRYIKLEQNAVSLMPWNESAKTYMYPFDEKNAAGIPDDRLDRISGYIVTASSLEVFGIAHSFSCELPCPKNEV